MRQLTKPLAPKLVAGVTALLVVTAAAAGALWITAAGGRAALAYQAERRALDGAVTAASSQGLTAADLAPITSGRAALDSAKEPWWPPDRAAWYDRRTAAAHE